MPRLLPDEFHFSHNLAFELHDVLADYVLKGEQAGLQFFRVPLTLEEGKAIKGLEPLAFWEWCEANSHRNILDEYSYRMLIFGLLTDFCQFVYEGLKCSEKAKLTVAFSDLRKPLQDNLFYLEWLLADRVGFLECFRKGPEHLDVGRSKDLQERKELRVSVIGQAMDKTPLGRWVDPEWLYELRYEKASDLGLDPLFNRALHLVTTMKHYATEPEDMNFLFFDDEAREELWGQLYYFLPPVLMHTIQVVRALFGSLDSEFSPRSPGMDAWLIAGYLLWADNIDQEANTEFATSLFKEVFDEEPLICPNCSASVQPDSSGLLSFWETGAMPCQACGCSIQLLELQADDEEGSEDT
jgi:hypothetical protein